MEYSLIYYPKCSTCVKGLALLHEHGMKPQLINYMTEGLSETQIAQIGRMIGSVRAIIREKTAIEKGVELDQSDDALIAAIVSDLSLLQRPILIKVDEAIVGRPIEAMLALK
ncbi:MAG: arsenate reductase [Hyphomonadaceae bacterium]|nr:MAG: arsenate reductase [Hyphomonadaceae bacterium]KAF0187057.1 MAG: arsenate reductase [Hyphomonadaceae bacterium]